MLMPKEGARFIASKAKDVFIHQDGINKCAKVIISAAKEGKFDSHIQNDFIPQNKDLTIEQLHNWVFLIDSLNFSFWTQKNDPKFQVSYQGKTLTGYLAMVAAVNRAMDEGKRMYDPQYYSKLSLDDMKYIFRADNKNITMPLLEKRVEIVSEVGNILLENYNGTFENVLKECNGSAMKLVEIIVSKFPCYRDIHTYEGKEVAVLKRAQILASDIYLLHTSKGQKSPFDDINELSMFADYRVPQALIHFGALSYSENLMEKLNKDHLFNTGEREEVEIRGLSIYVTELIVERARKILEEEGIKNLNINSIKVDYYLWDYRSQNAKALEHIPFHKTRCVYY
ncbi:UNVERIFIED_CONTAM: hypothetical protein RMT77_017970 [Armadillidium vulgare]